VLAISRDRCFRCATSTLLMGLCLAAERESKLSVFRAVVPERRPCDWVLQPPFNTALDRVTLMQLCVFAAKTLLCCVITKMLKFRATVPQYFRYIN